MNKIKYIIIFTLLLALGLIYKQLIDYKDIANKLLIEVNTLDNDTRLLKQQITEQSNKIIELEQTHQEQEEYIITIKNNMMIINMENNDTNSTNSTNDSNGSYLDINDTNQTYIEEEIQYEDEQTDELAPDSLDENDNIKIRDEMNDPEYNNSSQNAITGYGLEHME